MRSFYHFLVASTAALALVASAGPAFAHSNVRAPHHSTVGTEHHHSIVERHHHGGLSGGAGEGYKVLRGFIPGSSVLSLNAQASSQTLPLVMANRTVELTMVQATVINLLPSHYTMADLGSESLRIQATVRVKVSGPVLLARAISIRLVR